MSETPGRIKWLSVVAGYLVDFMLSLLTVTIASWLNPALGAELSFNSPSATLIALTLVLATGVGGWVAGRLARGERVLHGALVGGIGIIMLLIQSLTDATPSLIAITLQCVAVGVGALGGWLSGRIPTVQEG